LLGRNTVASRVLGVTDANGLISYTLTDAGTTGTRDTVTFSATVSSQTAGANVATINYGTVTVDKVVVSGGSKAETVAGSTLTSINAADNGPETSRVAIKAVVTDASGNLLAGVPVVFSVDSGLIYKTAAVDFATVYTGSDGSATTHVFDWKSGKQTITATAGGKSSTDYLTWASNTATNARVLSATATGDIVSLKVVDRFGNAVSGVAINLSRTGAGLFGNGASTQDISTDKNGTADVRFIGSGTVVAELAATYAQAYAAAGNITTKAATAAVAGTTKGTGATLAPAGVGKVSVAIAEGADPVAVSSQQQQMQQQKQLMQQTQQLMQQTLQQKQQMQQQQQHKMQLMQ
jgi:adhesin/invasin